MVNNKNMQRIRQLILGLGAEKDSPWLSFHLIGSGMYLQIQEGDGYFDFTLYGEDYLEIDGGQYDGYDNIIEAAIGVIEESCPDETEAELADYEEIEELVGKYW